MKNKRKILIGTATALLILLVFCLANRKAITKWFMFSSLRAQYARFISSENIEKGLITEDSVVFCTFEMSHDLDRGRLSENPDVG